MREPRERRLGVAVERRVLERDGCERERDDAEGRPDSGRRLGHPGHRPGVEERPARPVGGADCAARRIERERTRAGAEPRKRWLGVPIEQRVLECDRRERQRDGSGTRPRPRAAARTGCCGSGIQAIGQSSHNWQGAAALGITLQLGPTQPCRCHPDSQIGNSNTPTRVLSPGYDGSVRQSNDASSHATSANLNGTRQAATQTQTRPVCGCQHSAGIQAIGQQGLNGQNAGAFAASLQLGATERVRAGPEVEPWKLGRDLAARELGLRRPGREPVGDRPVADPGEKVGGETQPDRRMTSGTAGRPCAAGGSLVSLIDGLDGAE